MTKLQGLLEQTASRFAAVGIVSSQVDAELILSFYLGISRGELLSKAFMGEVISADSGLEAMISRREQREPLQHITKQAFFRGLVLEVGPGVFVPRPETEAVVQIGLDFLAATGSKKVLDIGTGSGAIAIALATESDAVVQAVELSPSAAEYASRNIALNRAAVELFVSDFRDLQLGFASYDLVISNPPYIPQDAIPIDPEVRNFDPELALYSGVDGLDLIREIIEGASLLLRPGGMLVLEHADGQSDQICELLLGDWQQVKVHPDPTGRLRSVSAIR
jgi:release factor glutamine methyltransferase